MLKKVLIPIDGTEASWKTLEYVKELGAKLELDLVICNVANKAIHDHKVVTAPLDGHRRASNDFDAVEDIQSSKNILELADYKTREYPYDVKIVLKTGNAVDGILFAAEESGCDAIFIGHRSTSALEEFLLGSVSADVVHKSKVSVFVIK